MRQLILKVPPGNKEKIHSAIEENEGKNTIDLPGEKHEVYVVFLPNNRLNNFLSKIDDIEGREINLIPRGVINLYPPEYEAPDQVADVHPKSSFEIYLGGIQSVGSIFGLLGYSFAAGIIVWIGLFTTTSYLLVAAMLVAPFAGPAMNAALATAAGKVSLLKSSLGRYGLSIITGIVAGFLMTVIFPVKTLTPLMEEVSQVSKFAVFLPLISGFAGAINLCQSQRDSLVSGAAVGILVAASLAPPVGLIGIGVYLMDWQVILSSVFRIVLQLLGIHLTATLVFYFYGNVSPGGIRFLKGSKATGLITSIVVIIGICAMMYWQFQQPPFLRKASMNTELTEVLDKQLKKIEYIEVLDKDVSFPNTKIKGRSIAKFKATVLPKGISISEDSLKKNIISHLKKNIRLKDKNIYQVYQIDVVED